MYRIIFSVSRYISYRKTSVSLKFRVFSMPKGVKIIKFIQRFLRYHLETIVLHTYRMTDRWTDSN